MLTAGDCYDPWPRGVTALFGGIRAQGLNPNQTDRIREWGTLYFGSSRLTTSSFYEISICKSNDYFLLI